MDEINSNEQEWEEIGSSDYQSEKKIWRPEAGGEAIIGVWMDTFTTKSGGKGYVIDKDGEEWIVWSSKLLDDKFSEVNIGDNIKIVFLGSEQSKINKMWKYKNYSFFRKKNQERITVETVQE